MRDGKSAGRPREFDLDQTLDVIMGVFWERGFEGTSLSDLVVATGLKKGSLYAAYGDKRDMYLRALARYATKDVAAAAAALSEDGDARARIRRYLTSPIDAVAQAGDRRGCFLCNASADQAALDPEIGRAVRRGFATLEAALLRALEDLGGAESPAELRARALMLQAVYSGLRMLARTGADTADLEAARDAAMRTLPAG